MLSPIKKCGGCGQNKSMGMHIRLRK